MSVPVSTLFAAEAVAYRLNHVGVRVVDHRSGQFPNVRAANAGAGEPMQHSIMIDGRRTRSRVSDCQRIEAARDTFANVDTAADDPAFLNFTSGTTGNPKGALQAHRSMLGHLPGAEFGLDFFRSPAT